VVRNASLLELQLLSIVRTRPTDSDDTSQSIYQSKFHTSNQRLSFRLYCCFTYHDIERVIGVQNAHFVSFEYVQHALGTPAAEKHSDDRQQHTNHLRTSL